MLLNFISLDRAYFGEFCKLVPFSYETVRTKVNNERKKLVDNIVVRKRKLNIV